MGYVWLVYCHIVYCIELWLTVPGWSPTVISVCQFMWAGVTTDNAMKQINIDGRTRQCQWWIAYKTRIIWTIFHQIILIDGPLLADVFMCLMMQSILVSHGPIYSRLYTWLTILLIGQHTVKVNCCMIIVFCFLSFFLNFPEIYHPK